MSCASLARRLETRRASIASPPGSTSTTYNSNSIAASSSRGSAIWRARHWPSLSRLVRARAARRHDDHVSAATSVRTRAAMVHRGTSSASGTFFTLLVPVDDVADPSRTRVNERATDARGCDDCRCVATIRILLSADSHRGECAFACAAIVAARAFLRAEVLDGNAKSYSRGTCSTNYFNRYVCFCNRCRVSLRSDL